MKRIITALLFAPCLINAASLPPNQEQPQNDADKIISCYGQGWKTAGLIDAQKALGTKTCATTVDKYNNGWNCTPLTSLMITSRNPFPSDTIQTLKQLQSFPDFGINFVFPVNPNYPDFKHTALHFLIRRYDIENRLGWCTVLLQDGANPSIPDSTGKTALTLAEGDAGRTREASCLWKCLNDAIGCRSFVINEVQKRKYNLPKQLQALIGDYFGPVMTIKNPVQK